MKTEALAKKPRTLVREIGERILGYALICGLLMLTLEKVVLPNLSNPFVVEWWKRPELHYLLLVAMGICGTESALRDSRWQGVLLFAALFGTAVFVNVAGSVLAPEVWMLPFNLLIMMSAVSGIGGLVLGLLGRSLSGALLGFVLGQLAGACSCEAALAVVRYFNHGSNDYLQINNNFAAAVVAICGVIPLAAANGVIAAFAHPRPAENSAQTG